MGFIVPRPSPCPECKGGRIDMKRCETCQETGTIFKVGSKTFPDTRDGYDQAQRELDPGFPAPVV